MSVGDFDADGLPIWKGDDDTVPYTHADHGQMNFRLAALTEGFDVPPYDAWLTALADCPAKRYLLGIRSQAIIAVMAGAHDMLSLLLAHLQLFRRMLDIADAVQPIVDRDMARQAGTRKPRRTDIDAQIRLLLVRYPDASAAELWGMAPLALTDTITFHPFRKRVSAIRHGGR